MKSLIKNKAVWSLSFVLLFVSLFSVFSILYSFVLAVQLSSPTSTALQFNVTYPNNLHRGDLFRVYANWTEHVNGSVIELNITSSALANYTNHTAGTTLVINETINKTWTNYTIKTNNTWALGNHTVAIYVNSTAEDTAASSSTNGSFVLWGWANSTAYLNPSSIDAGTSTVINCTVRDANASSVLNNSRVDIYDGSTNLTAAAGLTDSGGNVTYTYTPTDAGLHTIKCAIYDNATRYYNVSSNGTATLNVSVWKAFNATPKIVWMNWTKATGSQYLANITVAANSTISNNITAEVLNGTTDGYLRGNYSQPTTPCEVIPLLVKKVNATGDAEYNTTLEPLNGSSSYNSTNVTLVHFHPECSPGRYFTDKFMIRNLSSIEATNRAVNVTVYLDVPISTDNTLSNSTGIGTFSGSMPINATTYHSFYFNATDSIDSGVPNATSISINATSSADVDIFLFDSSGNLKAKSVNKTANSQYSEWLQYNYLPTASEMWEIRVYGNSTSAITYSGRVAFTTLNITNSAGQSISSIDFGVINVTGNASVNITLKNDGNLTLSSINESKELYWIKRFNSSGNENFTFLVPGSSITTRVKVSLNWTGASNYSFNLYNQDGTLVGSSVGKHAYANVSGAMQEEYNETTSIGSASKFWRVEVTDNASVNNTYTLTAYLYVSASDWIKTNHTTASFTGIGNTSNVRVNLTIPTAARNGTYEGHLQYLDSNKAGIKIPIKIDVTTPMLLVNNTMNSDTYRTDENYGANLTRSLYFNISNPGHYDLNVNFTDSGNLSYGSYNATLTYNTTPSISANSFSTISVNITFNSSSPTGLYEGWIRVNGTNSSVNLTAHPYVLFTINLQLNLTSVLDVRLEFRSADGSDKEIENSSVTENATIRVDVYYINGTGPITDLGGLSNFTSVWLQEGNVTTTRGKISLSSVYNATTGTDAPYCSGPPTVCPTWGGDDHYYINATVPANKPGGLYDVYVTVSYNKDSFSYSGTGSNGTLAINNTGLHMIAMNSTSISIGNSSTYVFYANVSNYGSVAASSCYIKFNVPSGCSGYSVAYTGITGGCGSQSSGTNVSITTPAYNTSCLVWWTITAGTSAASACTSNIIGSPTTKWFDSRGINVSVTVTAPSAATTTTSPSAAGTTTTTTATTTTTTAATTTTTTAPPVTVTENISSIEAGGSATVSIANSDVLKIQNITIKVKNAVTDVQITVKESSLPSDAPLVIAAEEGMVYKYLEIVKANIEDDDIENVKIKFKVEKSWVTNNEVDASTIALYKYVEGEWVRLTTRLLSSDDDYYYFEAESISLSVFAIAGEKAAPGILGIGWTTIVLIAGGIAGGAVLLYLFWPTKLSFPIKPGIPTKVKRFTLKPEKEEGENVWDKLKDKWSKLAKRAKRK